MSTAEAARRLGVSQRHLRRLVHGGQVLASQRLGRQITVDARSLEQYRAARADNRRGWSEETAWGAVALLSGMRPTWMGQVQRSRLKARLPGMSADEVAWKARNRAAVYRLGGHESVVDEVRDHVIATGSTSAALGLAGASERVDGYVDARSLDSIVDDYALDHDAGGNVVLRSTTFDLEHVAKLAHTSEVLAALDLAASTDPNERAAASQPPRAKCDGPGRSVVRIAHHRQVC